MDYNEFSKKLYEAYIEADGDLWKFWALLNPEQKQVARTTSVKVVYLYCNRRKVNATGEEFIKRVAKIGDAHFEFNFHTATVPKYHGYIRLEDYIINEAEKKVIVYKFAFLTSENVKK